MEQAHQLGGELVPCYFYIFQCFIITASENIMNKNTYDETVIKNKIKIRNLSKSTADLSDRQFDL